MTELLETRIENRWTVQPNHANNLQTAHGGNVLKWMDEAGAMSAVRFAGSNCVTAHIEGVNFERPIPVGRTVRIEAYVYDAGRTSIKVRLNAVREDLRTGDTERTTDSRFVYVAIDEDHEPTTVPELSVGTEKGERLREEALQTESPGETTE